MDKPSQASQWGIHAATVCPMHSDGRIDTAALSAHLAEVSATPGIAGLLLNGHAGEGHLLTPDERAHVLQVARANTPEGCFLTAGVTAESTAAAVGEARISARAGADAILVFPPNHWAAGIDADMALAHHAAIAAAVDLPLVLYKGPVTGGAMS
ncbi:MAG: dihydrodipicolinate synthase family protein, partial [Pararhodobacter sp.]